MVIFTRSHCPIGFSDMKYYLVLLLIIIVLHSNGQEGHADIQGLIEELYPIQSEDLNYEDFYEYMFARYASPIDINSGTREEIESLYILTPKQVENLISYREQNKILSLYELQVIPGFDRITISKFIPFVSIDLNEDIGKQLLSRVLNPKESFLILRSTSNIDKAKGYIIDDGYVGSRYNVYGRFRAVNRNDFSIGITFEKDAGESIDFGQSQVGFDFISFHGQLQNKGILKNLVLGDFQLQYGQGLVFSSGFSPGKGTETINTLKKAKSGINPYTSIMETGFFRGLASTIGNSTFQFSLFASSLDQDGNLSIDSTFTTHSTFTSSLPSSGLHRTQTELDKRNQLEEISVGGNFNIDISRKLNFGFNGLYSDYEYPIKRTPTEYNQFEFNGNLNWVSSTYLNYNFENLVFFGESAISRSKGMANILGLITTLSHNLDMGLIYRKYDKDFHSTYGNAFRENSRTINEEGFYMGIRYQINHKNQLSAFYDQFSFPWSKFRSTGPSQGHEFMTRYTHTPSKKISMYLLLRYKKKDRNVQEGNLEFNSAGIKKNIVFNADYQVEQWLKMKTRVQYSDFLHNLHRTRGIALIQDLNFTFGRWRISSRYALFDSEDYENRQYVYEKDVLYAFSIPAYNGQGTRKYVLLQFKANSNLSFWIKYAVSSYRNINSIGSGLNEIQGNDKGDVRAQMIYRF